MKYITKSKKSDIGLGKSDFAVISEKFNPGHRHLAIGDLFEIHANDERFIFKIVSIKFYSSTTLPANCISGADAHNLYTEFELQK